MLLYPLRRVGPKGGGQWQRITWDEALAEIAGRWRRSSPSHGAEAILPYSYSGTLGLVQMSVCNARLWNRLGASQLQRSICGAAAEFAVEATLGSRWSPALRGRDPQPAGHPLGTQPGQHGAALSCRSCSRPGAAAVRSSSSTRGARKTAERPTGTSPRGPAPTAIWRWGSLTSSSPSGMHDEAWLNAHTVGWPQSRANASPSIRRSASRRSTGLAEEDSVHLARLYGDVRPGLIKIADGINRNRNGGQNVRAVCALPALTGQYGVRGGGLAYSTSGYLAMGRRGRPPLGRAARRPAASST